jgi:hypothetical protein
VEGKDDAPGRVRREARQRRLREGRNDRVVVQTLGLSAPTDGDERQSSRDEGRRGEHRDQRAKPSDGAALERVLAFGADALRVHLRSPAREAAIDELANLGTEREPRFAGPRGHTFETFAAQQEARLTVGAQPFVGARCQPRVQAQVLPALVDPVAEPSPNADQCLVREFDRRLPRRRVTVEGQEPMAAERLDHAIDRAAIDLERVELRTGDTAARVLCSLARFDQTQEQLATGLLLGLIERREELLGSPHERPRDPPDHSVGAVGHRPPVPAFEQLGQGELEQGQRIGLLGNLGQHLGHEGRLERHADPLGGSCDRLRQLVGSERGDGLGTSGEERPEPRVQQGAGRRSPHAASRRSARARRGSSPLRPGPLGTPTGPTPTV